MNNTERIAALEAKVSDLKTVDALTGARVDVARGIADETAADAKRTADRLAKLEAEHGGSEKRHNDLREQHRTLEQRFYALVAASLLALVGLLGRDLFRSQPPTPSGPASATSAR